MNANQSARRTISNKSAHVAAEKRGPCQLTPTTPTTNRAPVLKRVVPNLKHQKHELSDVAQEGTIKTSHIPAMVGNLHLFWSILSMDITLKSGQKDKRTVTMIDAKNSKC